MIDLHSSPPARPAPLVLSRADADLLRRVVRHSPESLGRFYDAYAPRLFLFVSRVFPNDPAAADTAMEEIFWRVWKECATRPEETAELDRWMRRIVGASCRSRGAPSSATPARASRPIRAT